jgi:hypothetical protein
MVRSPVKPNGGSKAAVRAGRLLRPLDVSLVIDVPPVGVMRSSIAIAVPGIPALRGGVDLGFCHGTIMLAHALPRHLVLLAVLA